MLFHLAGEEGLRYKSAGFSGCAVCANSPDDIKEKAKLEMEAQSSKKVAKCASKISKANSIAEEGNMRADAQIAAGAKGVFGKNAAKIKADNAVSDFFDGCGVAHNKANSGLFTTMVQSIQAAGTPSKPYEPPKKDTLGGSILERQYETDMIENERILGPWGNAQHTHRALGLEFQPLQECTRAPGTAGSRAISGPDLRTLPLIYMAKERVNYARHM